MLKASATNALIVCAIRNALITRPKKRTMRRNCWGGRAANLCLLYKLMNDSTWDPQCGARIMNQVPSAREGASFSLMVEPSFDKLMRLATRRIQGGSCVLGYCSGSPGASETVQKCSRHPRLRPSWARLNSKPVRMSGPGKTLASETIQIIS